jgi:hypothetical protein
MAVWKSFHFAITMPVTVLSHSLLHALSQLSNMLSNTNKVAFDHQEGNNCNSGNNLATLPNRNSREMSKRGNRHDHSVYITHITPPGEEGSKSKLYLTRKLSRKPQVWRGRSRSLSRHRDARQIVQQAHDDSSQNHSGRDTITTSTISNLDHRPQSGNPQPSNRTRNTPQPIILASLLTPVRHTRRGKK